MLIQFFHNQQMFKKFNTQFTSYCNLESIKKKFNLLRKKNVFNLKE